MSDQIPGETANGSPGAESGSTSGQVAPAAPPPAVGPVEIDLAPAAASGSASRLGQADAPAGQEKRGRGRPRHDGKPTAAAAPEKKTSEKGNITKMPAGGEARSAADIEKCRAAGRRAAKAGAFILSFFGDYWALRIFKTVTGETEWDEPKEAPVTLETIFVEANISWFPGWLAGLVFMAGYIAHRMERIISWFRRKKPDAKADPKSAPSNQTVAGVGASVSGQHPSGGIHRVGEVVPGGPPNPN